MAAGVDELIDHLLSEVALTGVQGMHDSRDFLLQHTCLTIDSCLLKVSQLLRCSTQLCSGLFDFLR
jgi:hypothetical protein